MRAVIVREFGGPEALEIAEVPSPEPGPGQVRIRVAAAALNPVDEQTRAGALAGLHGPMPQVGIGWDVAGVIDGLGEGVTGFAPGDSVIGLRDRLAEPLGSHAEQVVLDASAVAPSTLDPVEGATLPLNALTAVQALDALDLRTGQTVLVTGAAGGLGGYLVELATLRGLRVAALAGGGDEELVRGLGAEFFVPRGENLAAAVRRRLPGGVDGVVDAAVLGTEALDAVRNEGIFVSVLGDGPRGLRGITVRSVWIRADGRALTALARLAALGRLTQRVAGTYPLAEAETAHRRLREGGLRGRLVLVP
ncbi:NADP-dependent oxidoreductase [Amycolatopsis cynarae]|uniref:NADP-dependent oxidoreductase n=1 Tax=Amycolatopsis cynarae TaxID=2995223 RepID=A0ABY7B592_9PSEU|nr:NADP-dependent oxidoreductase [Amycolatopsis sp. HUAS 11-8]WAL66388.1 NADP-dependent oxidoreductase [Amycolatopsis sp. HUAS 11-8]